MSVVHDHAAPVAQYLGAIDITQIQRSTLWLPQRLSPRPSLDGFGLSRQNAPGVAWADTHQSRSLIQCYVLREQAVNNL